MLAVRVGTIMHRSQLARRKWAIGLYLFTADIKGVSARRLHRELGIRQKSAWFLLHRRRTAGEAGGAIIAGPAAADGADTGGKCRNMADARRRRPATKGMGRGPSGRETVVGVQGRKTGEVRAKVVPSAAAAVAGVVAANTGTGAQTRTDEAAACDARTAWFDQEPVRHSGSEWVRDTAHANGMEACWSMPRRGREGIDHEMSPKHLDQYVTAFVHRHHFRNRDTVDRMGRVLHGMTGKRWACADLMADRGRPSGARAVPA